MPFAVSATTRIGPDALDVDEREHVLDELVEYVAPREATTCGRGRRAMTGEHRGRGVADHGEAAVDPDRARPAEAQLESVVLRRIVRRGEHRARGVERAGGVVQQVGRGEAEVDHVDALRHHAPRELLDQFGSGRSHVAGDEHFRGGGEQSESDTEGMCDRRVHLVGHGASDVVRLDDRVEHRLLG